MDFRLYFERDQILGDVQETMQAFDNDVYLLYYLKIIKTLRVKETDLRCITFYEELMLMKEFERTENELENKLVEAQTRFDNEQTKVNTHSSIKSILNVTFFRLLNFKEKLIRKRKILKV